MIRLTWRLARPNIMSSAALLAAVVLFAVLTRRSMSAYLDHSGLNACLAADGDCGDLIRSFTLKFDTVINARAWINLLPLLFGVFWGGPLIAREIEQGTHRLAWSQSISRGRWLATKIGVFMLGAILVSATLTALTTWWFGPLEHIREPAGSIFGRLDPNVFDFSGIVPVAYTIFAFALGVAAGAIIKRTIAATVVTLAVYLPVQTGIRLLRGHYLAPRHEIYPFGGVGSRAVRGDWIVEHLTIDKAGNVVDLSNVPDACRALAGREATNACIAAQGYRFFDTYQPIERFWPFQLIESGIFIGLAAVVLSLAAWWIIRRVA